MLSSANIQGTGITTRWRSAAMIFVYLFPCVRAPFLQMKRTNLHKHNETKLSTKKDIQPKLITT